MVSEIIQNVEWFAVDHDGEASHQVRKWRNLVCCQDFESRRIVPRVVCKFHLAHTMSACVAL